MNNKKQPEENPWTTLSEKIVYDNPWISVSHREVLNPSGGKGIYGLIHFKNLAIGIVPLDEEYNTWLVGQYRYTLNAYSWEIPEGGGPLGTSVLESAQRELKEETGIIASKWTKISDLHTSNSVTDEAGEVYVAQGLTFTEAEPEETEDLIVRKLPFSEALEMVMNGEITDALAMLGILKTHVLIERGEV
ncbi:MAG: NUDIX domain-containing protein [Saprospiraceae bacterium]